VRDGVGKTRSLPPPTTGRGERGSLTIDESSALLALDDPQTTENRR